MNALLNGMYFVRVWRECVFPELVAEVSIFIPNIACLKNAKYAFHSETYIQPDSPSSSHI